MQENGLQGTLNARKRATKTLNARKRVTRNPECKKTDFKEPWMQENGLKEPWMQENGLHKFRTNLFPYLISQDTAKELIVRSA